MKLKASLTFWEDWREWFRRKEYNWLNFAFIGCEIETHLGGVELRLALLGFHCELEVWDVIRRMTHPTMLKVQDMHSEYLASLGPDPEDQG